MCNCSSCKNQNYLKSFYHNDNGLQSTNLLTSSLNSFPQERMNHGLAGFGETHPKKQIVFAGSGRLNRQKFGSSFQVSNYLKNSGAGKFGIKSIGGCQGFCEHCQSIGGHCEFDQFGQCSCTGYIKR